MKKVYANTILVFVLLSNGLGAQNPKKIPRKEVVIKTNGDKTTTITTYTKPGRSKVISVTKKGNCLVSKSKIIYNTRTTYLTIISRKELIYDSLHCNKFVRKDIIK